MGNFVLSAMSVSSVACLLQRAICSASSLCRVSAHQAGLAVVSPLYFGMQLQGMSVARGHLHVDVSLLKEFLDTKGLWQEFGDFLASKSAEDSE